METMIFQLERREIFRLMNFPLKVKKLRKKHPQRKQQKNQLPKRKKNP
jgi:hypothetical protein